MSKSAVSILFLALLALFSSGTYSSADSEPKPAIFTESVSPSDPRLGEVVAITIHANIAAGWHLYSIAAVAPPGPSPTVISFDNIPGLTISSVEIGEDAPIVAVDPNFGKTVAFHEGDATFTLAGIVKAMPQTLKSLPFVIHYQTCNDTICLPPIAEQLRVDVKPSVGAPRSQYSQLPTIAPLVSLDNSPKLANASTAETTSQKSGWASFLAAAFIAGLLALLTPCVFPLIPVTFGFFTKQIGDGSSQETHRKLITMAGVYASGIVISFTALGLVAAALLGAAGANRIAANPWFNLFFGILFVVFAFSFFETFSFTLPPALTGFVRPSSVKSGYGGVLVMGLAFVFAAFTCTAPFIGSVLVAAASASSASAWLRPVAGMVCFSLALALPFFALALFPGLLTKLPRSGGWLTTFKAALGFIELAYALTYFSKADLVWHADWLTRPAFLGLWAMIALAGGLYLFGLLQVSRFPDEPAKLGVARVGFASLFVLISAYCVYALSGRPISASLAAYLPPEQYGMEKAANGNADDVSLASDAAWSNNLSDALTLAKQNGKPIFVDFTGVTCTNCRFVELNIFTKEPVRSLLENGVNRVRLYTDSGRDASANEALQQRLVGTVALPYYAILSPDGRVLRSAGGSSWSVTQFADMVDSALPQTQLAQMSWANYSPDKIASASESKTPIIIDFTASWCTNCHAIEKQVFNSPTIAGDLPKFTTLRSDLTDFYGDENAGLEAHYGIVSLPAVVFLNSQGKEIPGTRVTGLIDADEFLVRMKTAETANARSS